MANRIKLHIDTLEHINDLTFHVYRSKEEGVTADDTLVMSVSQPLSIKERYMQYDEILMRDLQTPYLFYTKRHYAVDQVLPIVKLGPDTVEDRHLYLNPNEMELEIHSGEPGVFDGRIAYIDYEYLAIPMLDDTKIESGKEYFGPIATGLYTPLDFKFIQDFDLKKIKLSYTQNRDPQPFFYRIFAEDSAGNKSPWSDERVEFLSQNEIYFRIQRSPDGEEWEDVILSNMEEWFDDLLTLDDPENLKSIRIFPEGSKVSRILFDNPWFYYKDYPRTSYQYRVRAEDNEGEHTEWVYFGPETIYIKPERIIIRRKVDNGTPSTKEESDAITVFDLSKEDIDFDSHQIELIDDQLTEVNTYSYTFFYEDEIGKEAIPVFKISNHMGWKNIIVFINSKQQDIIDQRDFISTFELADRIIEIGTEEGQ